MLRVMNRLLLNALILMDQAGGDGGAGGGGAGSLLSPAGAGSGAPSGGGDGGSGTPPDANSGGSVPAGGGSPTGGTPPADWRSSLPAELQESASLKRYKSVSDLAGAYINAEKLISGDKMAVPNQNWTENEWKNFFTKAGVPEKVDDYQVKFKEGVTIDEDFAKQFRENAHKMGVLPKQAQGLADWFSEINLASEQKMLEQQKAEFDKQVGELRKEWGNAFDLNIARANKLIKESGAFEHFQKMGYGSDPVLMKYLAKIAAEKYTDPKIFEAGSGGEGARTPAEIDAAIAALQTDVAYNTATHPGHKGAVERMHALHKEKFAVKKS